MKMIGSFTYLIVSGMSGSGLGSILPRQERRTSRQSRGAYQTHQHKAPPPNSSQFKGIDSEDSEDYANTHGKKQHWLQGTSPHEVSEVSLEMIEWKQTVLGAGWLN